ncbi:MAG TPA: hypothetical protein VJK51_01965 [Candidatus Nanoarchaeia archaeon]|nr:hypothetical protein [Candidatus Nanoarchaeia archaeon]
MLSVLRLIILWMTYQKQTNIFNLSLILLAMFLKEYWRAVKQLPPNLGCLYIFSKLLLGIGLGLTFATKIRIAQSLGLGCIVVAIICMIPAEVLLARTMRELIRKKKNRR